MENIFEILASTNDMVQIGIGGFCIITGQIVSVEKFADGLKLFFDNDAELFISSVYNKVIDVNEQNAEYVLSDTIHNLLITISII